MLNNRKSELIDWHKVIKYDFIVFYLLVLLNKLFFNLFEIIVSSDFKFLSNFNLKRVWGKNLIKDNKFFIFFFFVFFFLGTAKKKIFNNNINSELLIKLLIKIVKKSALNKNTITK